MSDNSNHSKSPRECLTCLIRWARRVFDAYMFFWLLLAGSIYVLLFVPQVVNVWKQHPPLGSGWWWLTFPLYVMILFLFYGVSLFVVLGSPLAAPSPTERAERPRALQWVLAKFDWLLSALDQIAAQKPQRGILCLMIGLTALVVGTPSENSGVYPLIGTFCRGLGLILAGIGLWLLSGCQERTDISNGKSNRLLAGWQRGYVQLISGAAFLSIGFVFDRYRCPYFAGAICRGLGLILAGTGFCLWLSDPMRRWIKTPRIGCILLIAGLVVTVVGLDMPVRLMTKDGGFGPDWSGSSIRGFGLILVGIGSYLVFAAATRWWSRRFLSGLVLFLLGAYGLIGWIAWSMMQYPNWQGRLDSAWIAVALCDTGLIIVVVGLALVPDPNEKQRNHRALGTSVLLVGLAGISNGVDLLNAGVVSDRGATYPWFAILCRGPGLILAAAGLCLMFRCPAKEGKGELANAGAENSNVGANAIGTGRWYVGRLLTWLLITVVLGEGLWILASVDPWGIVSYRLYTIWAILQALTLLVLSGLLIDRFWQLYQERPIRQVASILLLIGFWMFTHWETLSPNESEKHLSPEQVAKARQADKFAANNPDRAAQDRADHWFNQFQDRIRSIPEGQGPVVLVAASGGGSRAAIFAALTLETLLRTPLDPNSPLLGAPELEKNGVRTWLDNVILISSVSGGSLATAYYVHKLDAVSLDSPLVRLRDSKPLDDLRNTTRMALILHLQSLADKEIQDYPDRMKTRSDSEPEKQYAHQLDQLAKEDNLGRLLQMRAQLLTLQRYILPIQVANTVALTGLTSSPGGWNPIFPVASLGRGVTREYAVFLDMLNQVIARIRSKEFADRLAKHGMEPGQREGMAKDWVLQSKGFDEMCIDFMAPLMRGVLSPTLDRGDALARFWTRRFAWTDSTNFNGYTQPVDAWKYQRHHPLIVFNTYNVLHGSRLLVGFPPIPAALWQSSSENRDASHARVQSLDEVAPNFRVSLARAVRLSSNFPFGFRVSALEKQLAVHSSSPSNNHPEWIHLLDGGVIDNTGIDAIYELFRVLREHSESFHSPFRVKAGTILDELRRRGVVIMEIDAGEKPSEQMFEPWDPFGGPREPLRGLNNASYTNADVVKQFYVKEIRGVLKCRLDSLEDLEPEATAYSTSVHQLLPETVTHVTFQCNHYLPGEDNPDPDVMTAWTLGPKDKAQIVQRFLIQLELWNQQRQDAYWDVQKELRRFTFMKAFVLMRIISAMSQRYDELKNDISNQKTPEELLRRREELSKQRVRLEAEVRGMADKDVLGAWDAFRNKAALIDDLVARVTVRKGNVEWARDIVRTLEDIDKINKSDKPIEVTKQKFEQRQADQRLLQAATLSDPQWKFDLPVRRSKMLLEAPPK